MQDHGLPGVLDSDIWPSYRGWMLDDPCPKCGHRRKPMLMSTNHEYDDVTLTDMWNGNGEPWQRFLLRTFVYVMIFLVVALLIIPIASVA